MTRELPPVVSVWSAYGHRFIGDDDDCVSCLVCGALYELRNLGEGHGEYIAADGSAPMECSRDTSMAHGYPGERSEGNADHNCNCLQCH